MRLRSLLLNIVSLAVIVAVPGLTRSFAVEQPSDIPAWLQPHVGEGEGQIAPVVLQRARALYRQKVSQGAVKNPCYFAMDATRPGGSGAGFTSFAKPTGRSARCHRGTAAAATWRA